MALVPPITFRPTIDRPDKFFTLHTHPNTAFAMRLSDDTKISVVGFRTWGDAYFIGQKLELNYKRTQEWPDIDATQGALVLPAYSGEEALSGWYSRMGSRGTQVLLHEQYPRLDFGRRNQVWRWHIFICWKYIQV